MSRTFYGLRTRAGYVCRRCNQQSAARQSQRRALHATSGRKSVNGNILALLEERGYVNQIAGDRSALERLLQSRRGAFYVGIDPTAPSLHLGHLLPLMVLFWLYHHGHSVVSLVGGATAKVGDPSGRLTSRAKTAESVHETNFKTMYGQLGRIWENAISYGQKHGYGAETGGTKELLDNAAWLDKLNILDFLQMMGHGMRLGTMLGRDTVRNKMERGDGMSFSEFTYPLLQAWDWWHMYQTKGVQVQIGGSDQFGNIIAGMDAVKHIAQSSANDAQQSGWLDESGKLKDERAPLGLTVPLLTTSSGEKFGKSAGNAIWLDRSMTSAFDLYGFLLRSSDEDVGRYLKLFTFLPTAEVARVMSEHTNDPGKRKAQHLLASEVLELVHGREEAARARKEHQALRNPSVGALIGRKAASEESAGSGQTATQRAILPSSLVLDTPFSRILYHASIVPTKSEGARLVAKGGLYAATATREDTATFGALQVEGEGGSLSFTQIQDQRPEEVGEFITNGLLILRTGKWKVRVIEVIEDADFEAQGLNAPGWSEWKAISPSK